MRLKRKTRLGVLSLLAIAALGAPRARAVESGDLQRAQTALAAAVRADPGNAELWMHLGLVEHKLGRLDAAEQAFEKAAELSPQRADARFMLALIHEKRGETARAIEAWQACLRLSSDMNMQTIAKKHLAQLQPPAGKIKKG